MNLRALLLIFALTAAASAAGAEPVYVIEQVVVNVMSAPGGGGDRAATVKSGERLELVERQNDEAHVRLANGTEGWLKASYLSSEQPLQHRLTERTAEVEKLKGDLTRLQSELAATRVASSPAPSVPAAPVPGDPGVAPTASRDDGRDVAPTPAPGPLTVPDQPGRPLWEWLLGTATLMLLTGFAVGWRMLDRRIRRKFGGLRIY